MIAEPISIIMPVCNEVDVIEAVIEEWAQEVLIKLPKGSELILDDCSTDGTGEILTKLQNKYSFIKLNFAKRDGFFYSAIRLYKMARCNLIFFTDSDGQYIPKEFWKVAKYINDYDMVHGAKEDRKDPLYRVIVSRIYNSIVCWLFSIYPCEDINSAFRIIKRPLLTEILDKVHCMKMLPNSEIYIRAWNKGFKIKNVRVQHRFRQNDQKSRSLPAKVFIKECFLALIGLYNLRKQLSKKSNLC